MTDSTPARPKHVIVVDADNPLVEVEGEFFWREDHDQILNDAQNQAYQAGYQAGWAEGTQHAAAAPPQQVMYRYRPPLITRIRHWATALTLIIGALILLGAALANVANQ